jgi:serine/threonine-protein phosphatase 2A regulatory subunit B''
MAEVDKSTPQSIEYWFRCIDLDSDGVVSLFELEHFYEEQAFRLYDHGVDTMSFEDLACQT